MGFDYSRKKAAVIAAVVCAVVFGGVAFAFSRGNTKPQALPTQQNESDFDPKTDSEVGSSETETQVAADTSETPKSSPPPASSPAPASRSTPKKVIKPIIVGVDGAETPGAAISVDALAGDTTSGTCTATFSRSGVSDVTKTGPVERVTDYYGCQTLKFDRSLLPTGNWTLTVTVSGPTAQGISDPKTVTVK